jgi:3-hydroxyacyl-CoA dehydrogenase / enoyl-CoA hydratase / 3-hydroxybutyryl-CoA epimerase
MRSLNDLQLPTLRVAMNDDRIVTVLLDTPGKSVNSLTPAMLADLGTVLAELEEQKPAGVIFASAKKRSFIAGADLFEIRGMNRDAIERFLREGQIVFGRIARLPMPTAAAINADCLGGGLELALACTMRVAVNEGSISIGLPEVKLGILPGWGGTVRLPRLIGLAGALPLLLAGKTLPPRKALKAGIIDEAVRPEVLLDAAKRRLMQAAPRRAIPLAQRLAIKLPAMRRRIFALADAKARATTRGNYPAPIRLIDVVRTGIEQGPEAGMDAERAALKDLMETDAARNLIRLFFLRQGAKRSILESLHDKPADVTYAAVIGGGTMGAGIAHALIRAGIQVRLIEVDPKAVSGALGRIRKMLDDDVAAGRVSTLQARHAMNRVAPSCEWTGLKLADIVIEAVAEQIHVKRSVFEKLDRLTRPDAVLASNTSSLSIAEIAAAVATPARVIGLHFFNPVPKMPLVEVVRAPRSDDRSLATAAALSLRIGKTPLLVKDAPGFLVNRVLIPCLAEAIRAAAEGIPVPAIDRALKDWGMPMGPFELLDEIGLDIGLHVLDAFGSKFGDYASTPAGMKQAIERGWLGKKSGRGFYVYDDGHKRSAEAPVNAEMTALLSSGTPASAVPADQELQWRLVLPMVNEAARLLAEGVTGSADAVDLGTVLGLGLAPFRGGLAHFADTVGSESLVERMRTLASRHGPRFAPAPLLARLAIAHLPLSRFAELAVETASPVPAPASKEAHAMTT